MHAANRSFKWVMKKPSNVVLRRPQIILIIFLILYHILYLFCRIAFDLVYRHFGIHCSLSYPEV